MGIPPEWVYLAVGLAIGAAATAAILRRPTGSTDPRLLGTWQSDAARTIAEWRERRPITDEQASRLGQLFGHLRLTYAGYTLTVDWSGSPLPDVDRSVRHVRYAVVAQDATSAVVRAADPRTGVVELIHVHFADAETYWVHTDLSPMREYFRRAPAIGSGTESVAPDDVSK